jgi:hypothetical protein
LHYATHLEKGKKLDHFPQQPRKYQIKIIQHQDKRKS